MQTVYIARRFGVFLLIVWLAGTLNFFLPRLSGQDPVRTKLLQQAALGGYVQGGIDEMTREYEQRFGLDKPLWRQYLTYLEDVSQLDFKYSIANYPRTVRELIADALPWDHRPPRHDDTVVVRHRHLARSAARLAAGAALDGVADAAAVGVARDPVFPARPHSHLSASVSGAAAADFRRLLGGRNAPA